MKRRSPPRTVDALMIPLSRYPHIPATATLKEAIALIRSGFDVTEQFGFRRALVLGEGHTLKGIISITGLLRGLEPQLLRATPGRSFQGFVGDEGTALELFWDQVFAGGLREQALKLVGSVVRPIRATVRPGDRLSRALRLMLEEDAPILPVVEGDRVLGVIRLVDIFNEVATLVLEGTGGPGGMTQGGEHAG